MLQFVELLFKIDGLLAKSLLPEIKAEGLSNSEMLILWKVNRKGSFRATDLARNVGVPASTFTGIFDRLVAKGLLQRTNDAGDRRSVLVQGTDKLNELVERLSKHFDAKLADIFKSATLEDTQRFLTSLEQIHQYLVEYHEKADTRCD